MDNFGLNLSANNPLAPYLRQYFPAEAPEPQRNNGGVMAYEINSKSDIEYIEPDKSGRRQAYICESENKIYTGRYNHIRGEMDYRAYIDEGEASLFQKPNTDMTQIAEALVAVANKLDAMHTDVQTLKKPKKDKPFDGELMKKKGE